MKLLRDFLNPSGNFSANVTSSAEPVPMYCLRRLCKDTIRISDFSLLRPKDVVNSLNWGGKLSPLDYEISESSLPVAAAIKMLYKASLLSAARNASSMTSKFMI